MAFCGTWVRTGCERPIACECCCCVEHCMCKKAVEAPRTPEPKVCAACGQVHRLESECPHLERDAKSGGTDTPEPSREPVRSASDEAMKALRERTSRFYRQVRINGDGEPEFVPTSEAEVYAAHDADLEAENARLRVENGGLRLALDSARIGEETATTRLAELLAAARAAVDAMNGEHRRCSTNTCRHARLRAAVAAFDSEAGK